MVNDIIKLSQLDENSVTADKEPIDLYALAKSIAARLKMTADKNNVTISVEGEKTIVNGINSILDEIIYNLCENGVKYNVSGGTVKVFTGTENGCPIIRVSDTGLMEYQRNTMPEYLSDFTGLIKVIQEKLGEPDWGCRL